VCVIGQVAYLTWNGMDVCQVVGFNEALTMPKKGNFI
jgi:hypothetical protein